MTITLPASVRGPVLDLTLPASAVPVDIVLRNVTTGKTLRLNLPAEWDGSDLSLDFFRRTITDQGGADRSALLSPSDNELWAAEPLAAGSNDLELEALGPLSLQTKSPGTVANDATFGSVDWSEPNNAKASDNSYASAVLPSGESSHLLKLTNYGFTLPSGAVPAEVQAQVDRHCTSGKFVTDGHVRMVKGGAIKTKEKATAVGWPSADALEGPYGVNDGLWGETLAYTDVNASTFGIAMSAFNVGAGSATAFIDYVPLTVYYRTPAAYNATATIRWEKGYF